MFRKTVVVILAVFAVLVVGCAGSQPAAEQGYQSDIDAPDWYMNPPTREGSVLVPATARSRKMSIAIDRAQSQAMRDLAAGLESTVKAQREQYTEEVGSTAEESKIRSQYQDFTRELVDQKLRGTSMVEKAITKDDGAYRAYVLVELTMDDIKSKLSNKEELKTKFNAQEFEKDMEENLENLD